ncbi:MAG: hypothetical protein ACXVBK_16685 [Flavisolibacter sp.]
MKNAIFLFIAALFFTASVSAQSTVDSIHAKYQMQPMPDTLTIEKTFPVLGSYQLTTKDGSAQTVTVTLDSANKGIVWINGLPEGTMKAYLKKSPGTYRIVSQKSQSGTQIPEGTLYFDPTTNVLNVALGRPYNDADPTSIFSNTTAADATADVADNANQVKVKTKTPVSKTKTKSKLVFYTATKTQMTSTSTNAAKQ